MMTNTKEKAQAKLNEVRSERGASHVCIDRDVLSHEALCRVIDQQEDLATALGATAAACADHLKTIVQLREQIATLRQPTQSDALREAVIEECAKALEADARLCDCSAYEEGECACGAWCEWKSIPSARAVEIVRALQKLG